MAREEFRLFDTLQLEAELLNKGRIAPFHAAWILKILLFSSNCYDRYTALSEGF